MRKIFFTALCCLLPALAEAIKLPSWADNAIATAHLQLLATAHRLDDTVQLPRSTWTDFDLDFLSVQLNRSRDIIAKAQEDKNVPKEKTGTLRTCNIYDWTSGFFPGSLWYAYELTGDKELAIEATRFTNRLYPIRNYDGSHDIGFMINCSYGNALRMQSNDTIKRVIVETANTLCKRFNKRIGCIRSWDFGPWNYPVIIDNMMNLDLLFNAWHLTGDARYRDVAVTHAKTTMKHHFRPDYTCYHVVSYGDDGTVEWQGTYQGKDDASAWARGQGWALYGFTRCYMETGQVEFLNHAVSIANMIMNRVTTADKIPYWDYNAPVLKDTPRDASAAAITASAMLDLGKIAKDGKKYTQYAIAILKSLSSPAYLAKPGTNNGFILKHSVGSMPHGSEVDTPINYADYYFMEALVKLGNQK